MADCFNCCSSSDRIEQQPSHTKDNFKGPAKRRSCTDGSFLVLFIFVLISLFAIVIYCNIHGDVKRFFYGYDKCGNICGFKNEKNFDPNICTGQEDVSDKPFLQIEAPIYKAADLKNVERKCVKNCSNKYREFLHRCVLNNDESTKTILSKLTLSNIFPEVTQDLLHTKWLIIYLCLFAFVFSLVLVFLVRFVAGVVVWSVIIGVVVISFSVSIYLWIAWKLKSNREFQDHVIDRDANTYLAFALIATISTIIILLIIVAMRRRIALVVQLFRESGKAIQSMPLLLVQPMVTFFFLCSAIIIWSYFAVFIQSSGLPAFEPKTHNIYYKKDQLMKFARIYNILVLFWVIEFIIGCQHMIIAGSVATWFFTRNKENLSSPISTSVGYLFNYHLGSVAFGSLIIALLKIIKTIFNSIHKYLRKSENSIAKAIFEKFKCLFHFLLEILQYITRNAYIEIAIYGDNFCSSGQQACKVLLSNVLRVAAINSVGDFVLFFMKVLIVIVTVILGFVVLQNKPEVSNLWVPLTIVGIFAYVIAHSFISVYEMVIDTIFICFCEDCNINDGINREYYMSKELMDFVNSSQKVLRAGDGDAN